jgi:hypothetical protein
LLVLSLGTCSGGEGLEGTDAQEEEQMAFPWIEENTASRRRLEAVVGRLTEADMARTTEAGWTVSALLAHLAFWDGRMLTLIRRWRAEGVDESPVDPDMMNGAVKPLCLAMEPRAAARLCLEVAAKVDAELAETSPELVAAIEASPNHFRFDRGLHRGDHVGEIERLLGSGGRS